MGPQTEAASARSDARAQRRWLIGIAITVVFGIFGAVMALLAYTNGNRTSAPHSRGPATATPAASSPEPASSPTPDDPRGKAQGKNHGRK